VEPATGRPSILFVYFSYTQQTHNVVETMTETLRDRGCDVEEARIGLTDPRYAKRFSTFPMPHPLIEVLGMLIPELRRRPAEISIPPVVGKGTYDLVCFGSPTWWLSTNIPIRSFLQSPDAAALLKGKQFTAFVVCRRYWHHNLETVRKLGTKLGGRWIDGTHFSFEGGQVRSLLSLVSYLGTGEDRPRKFGIKIPPSNLRPHHLDEARTFANGLADRLLGSNAPQP
jgi:hypothetical protein